MNKIVFAMYDAGIANAVASALPLLAAKFDLTVIAQQGLAYRWLLKKLEFRERTHFKLIEIESFPMETAREFLLEEKPCAVLRQFQISVKFRTRSISRSLKRPLLKKFRLSVFLNRPIFHRR